MSEVTLHFGLRQPAAGAAIVDSVGVFPHGRATSLGVMTDGDGWNAWGEAPGTDVNDADTLHMIVRTRTPAESITYIQEHYGDDLVPMTEQWSGTNPDGTTWDLNGGLIIATNPEDWSEEHEDLRIPRNA